MTPFRIYVSHSESPADLRLVMEAFRQFDLQSSRKRLTQALRFSRSERDSDDSVPDRGIPSADLLVLMISPDYVASSYCRRQMELALGRQKTGSAIVVPVVLRPTAWDSVPWNHPLPENGRPVTEWPDLLEAIESAVDRVLDLIPPEYREWPLESPIPSPPAATKPAPGYDLPHIIMDLDLGVGADDATSTALRLHLADDLASSGENAEGATLLLPLADQFARDGFTAKAVSVLKKIQKIDPGRHGVDERLSSLIGEKQREAVVLPAAPSFEMGLEEEEMELDDVPAPAQPVEPGEPSVQGGLCHVACARSEGPRGQGDSVDCTVFAPGSIGAGRKFLVQVFVHRPGQEEQALGAAVAFDWEAELRGRAGLRAFVPPGATLGFRLEMPGMVIGERERTVVWRGTSAGVSFLVRCPGDFAADAAFGTVVVSLDSIPIGQVDFKLRVQDKGAPAEKAQPIGESAFPYTMAFVSYAREDRAEVLRRVQILGLVGIRHFQDLMDIEPGEAWLRRIERGIDECDLFLLFWSNSARRSEWVRRELRRALERKKGNRAAPPAIRPVVIEGPPPPPPPDELAYMQFDDPLLYVLAGVAR